MSTFAGASAGAPVNATRTFADGDVFFVSQFNGTVDFDADRLLFSMPDADSRWRIFEMRPDGSSLRRLPLIDEPDVDNYDACYLPDGRIIFAIPYEGDFTLLGTTEMDYTGDLWRRAALTGDWGGVRQDLMDKGVLGSTFSSAHRLRCSTRQPSDTTMR